MSKHRFLCASLTVSGLFAAAGGVVGCRPNNPQSAAPPANAPAAGLRAINRAAPGPQSPANVGDEPADTERPRVRDVPASTDVVTAQVQQYTKQVDAAMSRRAAGRAQPAAAAESPAAKPAPAPQRGVVSAAAPSGDPSVVKWLDPDQLRLGNVPPDAGRANAASTTAPPPPAPAQADGRKDAGGTNLMFASIAPTGSEGSRATVVQQPAPEPLGNDAPVPPSLNKDIPAVNTPLITGQPRPLPATDEMAQRFARAVKDYPQDPANQLDYQLLQFLQGQSVPDLKGLSTLQSEDREMVSTLLDGLTNFRTSLRADGNQLLSRKVRPLLDMSDRLKMQAELSIPTVALCTDVKGFGVYEPIEPCRFEAGKDHRVIVYCEVENFASQLDEQKRWETRLQQEVVLYTEQTGLEVWRDKAPARPIIDYSRNRRHDFFIVKMIRLPANLNIDRYLLKVTVTDQQVSRVAENSVPIQIVAQ